MDKQPKLAEIAKRISEHLRRFEADKNGVNKENAQGLRPYYSSMSWASGSRVGVCYVSFQGREFLTKADASKYLAWLDAGNIGRHYKMLKQERI